MEIKKFIKSLTIEEKQELCELLKIEAPYVGRKTLTQFVYDHHNEMSAWLRNILQDPRRLQRRLRNGHIEFYVPKFVDEIPVPRDIKSKWWKDFCRLRDQDGIKAIY